MKPRDLTRNLSCEEEILHLPAFQLVILSKSDQGKIIQIDKDFIRIGSMDSNDLQLNDDSTSRVHCEISRSKEGYQIKDLQSTNGTFVNGTRIQDALLQGGEVIQLGETELRFQPARQEITIVPSERKRFGKLLGTTVEMRKIFTLVERVSSTDVTVIIEGETGTGKEILAQSIHENSKRSHSLFIAIDCGAVPKNLMESLLFGHEKGAFTGASEKKLGAFETVRGGTIFLDEIGNLDLELQPKLLRVLEQREIRRLGGNDLIPIDVRILAATNLELEKEVEKGRFREDLFFRLNVIHVRLPALRERMIDIPLFVDEFVQKHNAIEQVSSEALMVLKSYEWPGNIRQLNNVLERASAFSKNSILRPEDFFLSERIAHQESQTSKVDQSLPSGKTLEEIEKAAILATLQEKGWNKKATSKVLGIAYSTLHEKIKKYDLKR